MFTESFCEDCVLLWNSYVPLTKSFYQLDLVKGTYEFHNSTRSSQKDSVNMNNGVLIWIYVDF